MSLRAFWKLELFRLHETLANHVSHNRAFASEIVLSQITSADYFAPACCPNRAEWHVFAIREGQRLQRREFPQNFSGSEKRWRVCLLLVLLVGFWVEQNIFFCSMTFLVRDIFHRLCSHTFSAPDFQKYPTHLLRFPITISVWVFFIWEITPFKSLHLGSMSPTFRNPLKSVTILASSPIKNISLQGSWKLYEYLPLSLKAYLSDICWVYSFNLCSFNRTPYLTQVNACYFTNQI